MTYYSDATVERRVKDVECPQCGEGFRLRFNDWDGEAVTLILRGCPSGGIYDVIIRCPRCDYEEPL